MTSSSSGVTGYPNANSTESLKEALVSPSAGNEIPITGQNTQHIGILQNWVDAVINGTELLAPGIEGMNGLQISNAMHLSAWTGKWAEIPVDEDLFYELLQERIKNSGYRKNISGSKVLDVSGTH